jgi:RecB family endonuclease NucS
MHEPSYLQHEIAEPPTPFQLPQPEVNEEDMHKSIHVDVLITEDDEPVEVEQNECHVMEHFDTDQLQEIIANQESLKAVCVIRVTLMQGDRVSWGANDCS